MYKDAIRQNLTFATPKGVLNLQQLWNLTLVDLTASIKAVNVELVKSQDDNLDFLDTVSKVDKTQKLRFDILKDVYLTKKEDNEKARIAKANKENNQKLIDLIAKKKDGALEEKSIEELEAMLVKD